MSTALGTRAVPQGVLRRVLLGVGSSALAQGIGFAQAVVLVPLFLHAWGADGYGRWLTLAAVVSYLSLLDLGGQSYVGNLLAMHHALEDTAAFQGTLSEAVSFFLGAALVLYAGLVGVLAALFYLPVPLLGRPLEPWEVGVLASLSGLSLLLSVPGGVYVTAYRATGLFARGAMVGNVVRALGVGISAWALYVGFPPHWYAALIVGVGALLTLVIVLDSRRVIPECRSLRLGLDAAGRGICHLGGSVHFWLISVAQAASQQGVVLILAAVASPTVVALYVTHRTLASIPAYVGVLLQGPLLPELSFLWARQRLEELARSSVTAIRTVVLATGALAALVWLSAPFVYPAWTARRLAIDPLLLGVFLVQAGIAAGWTTSAWSLLAANRHRPLTAWYLVNAGVTVGLAALLVREHGALGVAMAGVLGDLGCSAVVPRLTSSFLGLPPSVVYQRVWSALLVLVPVVAVAAVAARLLPAQWAIVVVLGPGGGLALLVWRLLARLGGWRGSMPASSIGRSGGRR